MASAAIRSRFVQPRLELQRKPHASDAHQDDRQRSAHTCGQTNFQTAEERKNEAARDNWSVVTVNTRSSSPDRRTSRDALVEVRWLDTQEEQAQERCQRED